MSKLIPLISSTKSRDSCGTDHPAELLKDIDKKDLAGANVVFINMPLRESARPNTTPEGPLLMATRLKVHYGVNASVIDLNAYRTKDDLWQRRVDNGENIPWGRHKTFKEAEELIQKHISVFGEPTLIGFSGKITTFRWQREVAQIVRKMLPDIFLVTGGSLATELKTNLFNYIPEFDGVAHSEGDDVIVKIVYDAILIKKNGYENAINSGKLRPYHLGSVNGRNRFLYEGDRPLDLNILPHADLE